MVLHLDPYPFGVHAVRLSGIDRDGVPDADRATPDDLAIDPEGDGIGRLDVPPVGTEDLQRLQIDLARLRMPVGDHAAPDVPVAAEHRLSDPDALTDPSVLLVGADAIEFDQHPEAPGVDARSLRLLGQPLQRATGDQRDGSLGPAVDRPVCAG